MNYRIFINFLLILSGCYLPTHLGMAESAYEAKKYNQAINEYELHIKSRLESKSRPDWENPYFYELIIGDIELEKGNFSEAIIRYKIAEDNKVELERISTRILEVGKQQYQLGIRNNDNILKKRAIKLLQDNAFRDSELYYWTLDKLVKQIQDN